VDAAVTLRGRIGARDTDGPATGGLSGRRLLPGGGAGIDCVSGFDRGENRAVSLCRGGSSLAGD